MKTCSHVLRKILLPLVLIATFIHCFLVSVSWEHVFSGDYIESSFPLPSIRLKDKEQPPRNASLPIYDKLCGGCRLALLNNRGPSCANVSRRRQKEGQSLVNASVAIAQKYKECHRCDPGNCKDVEKQYWWFDQIRPRELQAITPTINLPAEYKLPPLDRGNFSSFFKTHPKERVPHRRYLFEYNPSLIRLPQDQVPGSLAQDQRYYLGVIRLSTVTECFTKKQTKLFDPNDKMYPGKEFLGFVIYDENLQEQMETVVYHRSSYDQRLFLLNNTMYLGFMDRIVPFYLKPPASHAKTVRRLSHPFDKLHPPFGVFLKDPYLCCRSPYCQGKNFNYFIDTSGHIMVETKPLGPHVVEPLDMHQHCERKNEMPYEINYEQNKEKDVFIEDSAPPESFYTTDEVYFPNHSIYQLPYTSERGTTCCVPVSYKNQTLLAGVSHTKIPTWKKGVLAKNGASAGIRHYSSRLYAFEPFPPYRIVARSGKFCLGFGNETNNPNHIWVRQHAFEFAGETLSCPSVTFVSSMIEAHDATQIILSYGINDCMARIIRFEKSELVRMLFGTNGLALE